MAAERPFENQADIPRPLQQQRPRKKHGLLFAMPKGGPQTASEDDASPGPEGALVPYFS